MILYYSSTGNSYHVAREINKRHPGKMIDMAKADENEPFVLADGEMLFIVTFNCFWGVSDLVKDFFKQHRFSNVQRLSPSSPVAATLARETIISTAYYVRIIYQRPRFTT